MFLDSFLKSVFKICRQESEQSEHSACSLNNHTERTTRTDEKFKKTVVKWGLATHVIAYYSWLLNL